MTDSSFSVQLASLLGFASELQTQTEGVAAPINTLATQSGSQPQLGAFTEAATLAERQQAAVQEMYGLLSQVRQAIGFAADVTNTVASGYQQADHDVAASLGNSVPMATAPPAPAGYPLQPGPAPYGSSYYGV